MQTPQRVHFDPAWRDDIFDIEAISIPLVFPDATAQNNEVWIAKQTIYSEIIFEHEYVNKPPRVVTSVLKPSDKSKHYMMRDSEGDVVSNDLLMSAMFSPKAWMSDSAEERCMMFAAAKMAKGDILVGGLGLGVYPQLVLALNRPVKSITIIERDEKIIDLMKEVWLNHNQDDIEKITIIKGTVEEYLSSTEQIFDTIYLDIWEDADPRFLPYINYLITLASNRCSKNGMIQCWGYSKMIDTFIENAKVLTQNKFPLREYNLDPALEAYVSWLEKQEDNISESTIIEVAKNFALTVEQSIDNYDRDRCFTSFGTSTADFYRNLALSKK